MTETQQKIDDGGPSREKSTRMWLMGQVVSNAHFFQHTKGGMEGATEFCFDMATLLIAAERKDQSA